MSDIRRRGFALIAVLWFLVLIAAIGTYLMANARTETAIARNIRSSARAEALADAGIAQTVFNLDDVISSNRWKLDGTPHQLKLSGGELTIRVSDETAKVNPNHASPALMAALFEAAGIDRARAKRLSEAVAYWVGPARTPSPGSPIDDPYERAGLSYRSPHALIENLDELQLIIGMTPELFASIRPYLTIYTQADEPDAKNASPVVQRALLLAAKSSPEDAGSQPDTDPVDTDPDSAGSPAPANPAPASQADAAAESVVEVTVTARSDDGGIFVRHAVLRLEDDGPKGYATLEWRRGDLVND